MPWQSKKPGSLKLFCQGSGSFTAGPALEAAWSGLNGRQRMFVPYNGNHRIMRITGRKPEPARIDATLRRRNGMERFRCAFGRGMIMIRRVLHETATPTGKAR